MMVRDLEHGVISGVLAHNIDRIARQPRDLERLIDIYEEAPSATRGTGSTTTAALRTVAAANSPAVAPRWRITSRRSCSTCSGCRHTM
ncbi:hypothetical protein ACFWR9_12085 [Streptomyces sp. NPDC058534]|uniref:hypothetical protein n=1 Tax=Streptomyces sp. NPDC058534 TaxID=3346541 RepID=UPI0036646C2E